MQKNATVYWLLGGLLLSAGVGVIVSLDAPWGVLCLALGGAVAALPALPHISRCREALAVTPCYARSRHVPDPLFLARAFFSMSIVAHHSGILELEYFIQRLASHTHFLLRHGLEMILDGVDPEVVQKSLRRTSSVTEKNQGAKCRDARQIVLSLLFVALTTAVIGALAYGVRFVYGNSVGQGSLLCLLIVSGLLTLSAAASLLLLARVNNEAIVEIRMQRQITAGVLALQQGESYRTLAEQQLPYLTYKERLALAENPLLDAPDFYRADAKGIAEAQREIKDFLQGTEE